MQKTSNISEFNSFYKQLFNKFLLTTTLVVVISLSYILFISLDVVNPYLSYIIVALAFIKTIFIVSLTFIQLSKIIGESHKLSHVLTLFGFLILLIVLSFSFDYHALYAINAESFKTSLTGSGSFIRQFFEFLYFSLITFSSVGFGDIVPISVSGKIIVILEVFLSFFVLVFGIANINRIHVDK
ncbi:potassium channel family protein [Lutibacter sp. B1]|uniref:potassium channel family protein n=1 Tax=Lutibacter sp. B1 TaxID=2725996 RepID=UPI0014570B58|nr:potassium channel family protein [Lutibacter sp. B1]NLP58956.1 two pore domain potassium channel family protein [Lutibacter sp. B1]